MKLPNRGGETIDPVPFLVVASLTILVTFSFGPIYGLTVGLSLRTSLVGSGAIATLVIGVAYYRMVWTMTSAYREAMTAEARYVRLVYLIIALFGVMALLSLPFL
ncbi:MAG: hypothetical protein ACQETB_13305 [Halobacteriota archaeon]